MEILTFWHLSMRTLYIIKEKKKKKKKKEKKLKIALLIRKGNL